MIQWNEHFIDGGRCQVRSGRTVRIHDAATEAPLGDVHLGSADDVDQAVAAARQALPAWQRMGVQARASLLYAVADALESMGQALARDISREVGMPLKLSQRIQVDAPVAAWRATAALADTFAFVSDVGNSRVTMVPVGVVAAITPWN